jgi:GWxTD domain-containing protein
LSSNRSQRAERGPSGPLFFALVIYFLFSTIPAFADDLLNWDKSPEAYFMTAEERTQWNKTVLSPADAQKFIDEYWRKRGEQFKKEVHSRIEFADKQFAVAKVPGARTEMGRVWMILGTPSTQRVVRGIGSPNSNPFADDPMANKAQNNAVEQAGRVTTEWLYRKDRLHQELGMTELTVRFQTDVARGAQTIENPGLVEPYLTRAATYLSTKSELAAHAPSSVAPAPAKSVAQTPDPLWGVTTNLNGAIYTADAFVSPRDNPFYAVSFFLPREAPAFTEWKNGLFVGLIRDVATGREVVTQRQPVELATYDDSGNRYVDRSFALEPGKYEGLFALYSPDGATLLTSTREQFEVPAVNAPRASKLFLSSRVDTLDKQDALDPFTFVAQKYAVRGDRRFRAADKLTFFTVIANPTGSPDAKLMQKMTFTRDGKPFAKTPLEPAALTQTGPNTFLIGTAFDPDTFKPGHYTLELQVRDFNAPEGSDLRTKGYVLSTEFDVVQ